MSIRKAIPPLGYVIYALAVLTIGLVGAELYARQLQGYRLWNTPLQKSYFFELDRLKIWNRHFYESKRSYFNGWPVPLEFFNADKVTPRFLFKPNLRMARRGNQLVPASPGEKVFWSSNSWGFRGPEFSVAKPAGLLRIVCLGASTTEGSQDDDETYPHFLQRELSRLMPSSRVEVINAGHHGHGIDDLLEILRHRILPLKPDVVIFYEAGNNIEFGEFTPGLPCRLGFPEGNCWLYASPNLYQWLYHRSGIFVLLSEKFSLRVHNSLPMSHKFVDSPMKPSALHYKEVLRQMVRETLAQKVAIVLSSFITLAHEGLEVSYEQHPLLYNDIYKKWSPLTPGELERIYQQFNRQSEEIAGEFGLPYADVAMRFPREIRFFPFDLIHLSPEGNKLLAALVADYLVHEILPAIENIHKGSGI